jgi:hypothetical protein
MQTSGALCREIAASYSVVIVREGGRSSIPETPLIEPISRSVLDTPHARGMTRLCNFAVIARSEATKQSIYPRAEEMDCFAALAMMRRD